MEKDIITAACDLARAQRAYYENEIGPNLNAWEDAEKRLIELASQLIDSVDGW